MKIEFSMEGGFAHLPGLSKPVSIDLDALPAKASSHLRKLVEQAQFFARGPAPPPAATRGADRRSYTLTIEDGKERRSMTLTEPITDPALHALVEHVRDAIRPR